MDLNPGPCDVMMFCVVITMMLYPLLYFLSADYLFPDISYLSRNYITCNVLFSSHETEVSFSFIL